MKLLRVDFDEEENPETFGVSLSRDEMALLYNLTGRIGPLYVTQSGGDDTRWGNACIDIAQCAGNAFNHFYDDGVNDVAPKFGIMEIAERARAGRSKEGDAS